MTADTPEPVARFSRVPRRPAPTRPNAGYSEIAATRKQVRCWAEDHKLATLAGDFDLAAVNAQRRRLRLKPFRVVASL